MPGEITGQTSQRQAGLFRRQHAHAKDRDENPGIDQQTSKSLHPVQCRPAETRLLAPAFGIIWKSLRSSESRG